MTPKNIKQTNLMPAIRSATGLRPSAEGAGATEATPGETAPDRITTSQQVELQAAIAQAKSAAKDARAARLAEIEAAVRKGEYQPDPARIAQRILDEAELLAKIHVLLRR